MTPEAAKGLRDLMIDMIEEIDPERRACLALSGGTDSTTVLFAMLETGRRPRCYTFFCENTISTDLQASRALCKQFDLELVEIMIPWDLERLVADVRTLTQRAQVIKKTVIQCMHPWLYIYPEMQKRGDTLMLNGLGGDDHYCSQRKVMVAIRQKGEQFVRDQGWRRCFSSDFNFSSANIMGMGKAHYGITNLDLYNDKRMDDWFNQFDVMDLHRDQNGRGLEKAPSILAFMDLYKQTFRRDHQSYQINSKLKDMHEALLLSPVHNPRKAKDVISIYRDIANGNQ